MRAVGIEPTFNGLRIRCLASRPGTHKNIIRLFGFQFATRTRNEKAVGNLGIEPSEPAMGRSIYSRAQLHTGLISRLNSHGGQSAALHIN